MDMKWTLIGCIGIMIASCGSDNKGKAIDLRKEGSVLLCECVMADTVNFKQDSCLKEVGEKFNELLHKENFSALDTMEFEIFFEPDEMEEVCPGWKALVNRKQLTDAATDMAKDKSYMPAVENEMAGKILSWQKLEKGEGEYEIVVRSTKDSITHTFITQAKPPKGDEPAIIYITFEPNEAAYHEKYPFRAVQVRFTSKK